MVSSDVLDLREDPVKGVCVAGLSEIEVDTPEEILDLLMYKYNTFMNFIALGIETELRKPQAPMKLHQDRTQSYRLFVSIKTRRQGCKQR